METIEINQEAINKLDKDFEKQIIDLVKSMNNQDSIEIGNSKTGVIKVYCNFENKEEAIKKIENAIFALKLKRGEVFGE
jgi:hypothetical protein